MPYIIKGSCNQCGKCCLRSGGEMIENPMIELTEDRCKFYVDTLNTQKYGHCLIFARGNKPIKNVKDRNDNKITDDQIRWFNDNCLSFPKLIDITEKDWEIPPYCSFTIEEV